MKAIRVHHHGDPDVLQLEDVPLPEPGPDEVRVKIEAAGVNYIDTYHRRGQYAQDRPFTPGMEGGGVVDTVGAGVLTLAPGDRVAYAMQIGAYAECAIVPASRLVTLPDGVSTELAAAVMLQGMTAHYLTHSAYPIQSGDTVLVHAAAGGVGLLLVQLAKLRGARVIGTTSTPEKAALARAHGADEVILYTETDFETAVRDLTKDEGVHAVYDGVGKDTFRRGLDCLRPRGYMVLYGQASGPVAPIDPQILNQKGSLFLTRPSLRHYAADQAELTRRAEDLFGWIAAGELRVHVGRTYPLADAAAAHADLEGRRTTGKLLLQPDDVYHATAAAETIDVADPVDEAAWESFPASDPPPY
ncbi:MAG: quinone oxidoreductase [Anaerolineales bacterium]|nr:quinone oxidoreductase [Anaerolineales bacterium]